MVQEYRKIMLSDEEVISAFEGYRRITPNFMPNGKILSCALSSEGTLQLSLQGAPSSDIATFTLTQALNPIIRFCIENNIILPKNGHKHISTVRDIPEVLLSLDVAIDITAPLIPMLASHLIAPCGEPSLPESPPPIR